ncbi:MAG: hypothetical protein ABI599_00495 [Flavobacteriales bacterium]
MENKITVVATQLAIRHSDDADIPARFRTKSTSTEKAKSKASEAVEARFIERVKSWSDQIRLMLGHLEADQAWRFITTSPHVPATYKNVVECQDFLDFNSYVARRRDQDKCSDDELGQLALLLTELQGAIESKMSETTAQ